MTLPALNLPPAVSLVEVGLRDGLQNEPTVLDSATRCQFARRLADCGLKRIEAGAFVHSRRVPQMANSDQVLQGLAHDSGVSWPVLVPNRQGLDAAITAGAREIAVFLAASETFSQHNINCGIAESIERSREVVEPAITEGLQVRGYVSCVMGCPYQGPVDSETVIRISRQLIDLGCYQISLGDTIGVGTPLQTRKLLDRLLDRIPADQLAVHFHDTYGQALANILAALQAGIMTIDSSVAGLGGCPYARGASGNVATEDVVYMLNGLGIKHGVNLTNLIEVGRDICKILERPVMSKVSLAKSPNPYRTDHEYHSRL